MSPQSTAVYAFSFSAVPVALTALLIVGLGLRIVMRRRNSAGAALFALTLATFIWFGAFTMVYLTRDPAHALWWARLAYLGVPFIPPAVYWFTVEILRTDRSRKLILIASWTIAAVFSTLAVTGDTFVTQVQRYAWGYAPRYSLAVGIPFVVLFVGQLAGALFEFRRAKQEARGAERRRIRLFIIAFSVASLGLVDFCSKFGLAVYPFGYLPILALILIVERTVRQYDIVALTPSLAAPEIIGTMADLLFVCDREGTIEVVNPSAASLLGHAREELIGRRIDDFIVQPAFFAGTLDRRSFRNADYPFRTAAGEQIDLTLSISPVVHDGSVAGAVIIGRDTRERRQAEREIARAVTLLQSTLDSTADGIVVVDETGRLLSHNQRFVEMWGIPPEVMESRDDQRALECVVSKVADPDGFRKAFRQLSSMPEGEDSDVVRLADGRLFERYSIGRRVRDVETIRVWSFRDVTARLMAEDALRDSEIRYRLLFEQNAAGVCVSRLDGEIVDCNHTFAHMLGIRRERLVGSNMVSLYRNGHEAQELTSLLRSVGLLNSVEIEFRGAGGKALWVLENLVLVGEGDAAVVHATVVDISDRKRAEEQIEFHAYHDVLTRLPNRKLFTDRLRQSVTRARRNSKPVAVMFIDVDHFKTINDTLGHTAGDELLLEMARRLRDCVREDDTVARLGGDEFTIVLSDLRHAEDAVSVAQKILASVQEPLAIGGVVTTVTASIGIAIYPEDGLDPETLLRNADSAMYRAKEEGRNTYQLCTDDMKRRALERLAVESRLRNAVNDEQLMLLYQPQINLMTGRTIGVEALVRWNDPERGIVEPASFIPIAEETRLILPLGEWVLRTACRQMHAWHAQGAGHIRVAVNLSARQFLQHDLVEIVRSALQESELDPTALELEITETTAMQNADVSVEVMRALRALGVGILIDDFGMGYSSLNYLKRFPITGLKVDRAFMHDLTTGEGDATIVSAVIGMARTLRLRVIAEGVETAEQFAFLRSKECDEAQGFYFGRPASAEAIGRQLMERAATVREPRLTI